jgi:hypothetical protein
MNLVIGLVCLSLAIAEAAILAVIAERKNRNPWLWVILGLMGGFIIPLIFLACLSTLCPKCGESLTAEQWCPYCKDNFLNAAPPKPPRNIGVYILVALAFFVIGTVGYVGFRNFPEERAISRFLNTLEQGNYREAYQLWQPSDTYSYGDFLHNWGESGDYGKIHSFKILGSRSRGENTVIVVVTINDEEPALELVVDRKTKGLAFSPF